MVNTTAPGKQLTEQRKDLVKQVIAGLQETLTDDEALTSAIRMALPVLKAAKQLSSSLDVQAKIATERKRRA